jgi:hypothetical protein
VTVTALLAVTLAACATTREAALLDARLRSDDRVVDIVAAACNPHHTDVTVDEAPGEVQVLVTVTDPSENEDCATGVAIELDDPLGDRAVVDALTQRRVAVSR